ncbi:hypothetical protein ABZ470_26555 [Streptosporangium sp. NPDC020072]|uniref:hypothetical protein n=1 Tax=Streptosporangium sp. NPDC020072 TaxID=3154788 RepID=UPI00341B6D04
MAKVEDVVQLIADRREHPGPLRRRISSRAATSRFTELSGDPLSVGTWRRIELGEKVPEDREVVFMSAAINDLAGSELITPDDLAQHGRPTAADLLRQWNQEKKAKSDPEHSLTTDSLQQRLQDMISEIHALPGISASEKSQMEKVLLSHIESTIKAYSTQLRILKPR